jgi:hypothetical protein
MRAGAHAVVRASANHHLFDVATYRCTSQRSGTQVENRIAHDLARSVIGHVARHVLFRRP